MSKTVSIAIVLGATTLPSGTLPLDKYRFQILDRSGAELVKFETTDTAVDFDDVAEGDYTFRGVGIDANGNELGDPITQAFTVPADTPAPSPVTLDLPVSATITFSN